jgi:hypothetical protein
VLPWSSDKHTRRVTRPPRAYFFFSRWPHPFAFLPCPPYSTAWHSHRPLVPPHLHHSVVVFVVFRTRSGRQG